MMLIYSQSQFFTRSSAPITPSLKMKALRFLAKKHKVDPRKLQYIGILDASEVGKRFLSFNIEDPSHPRFRSTVEYPIAAASVECIIASVLNRCYELRNFGLFKTLTGNLNILKVLKTEDKGFYILKTELVEAPAPEDDPIEWTMAYTHEGNYIGDPEIAEFLFSKVGLTNAEPANKSGDICNIGFHEKEQKWYGWSDRAICGFGIGDRIFEKDYGSDQTPFVRHGRKTIKTLENARLSAINFAEYIYHEA